ncbi:MAG TPA: hypothetical protein VK327_13400 [Candidatus Paceibacterota bacterium]|nr:hypothetical protein [Candidatus Paceibacterota bacterium]
MSAVSETIVREYFELHGFLIRQHRKYIAQTKRENDDVDFFVLNPRSEKRSLAQPFVLDSADLKFLKHAVVVVKGWHTETFSSGRLASTPDLFQFVGTKDFQKQTSQVFGDEAKPANILVVPALPQQQEGRDKSVALLRSKGVDGVIPFSTMLADLVTETEVNRNYQKSDLLQTIRILKNYDFIKDPQMDLFKSRRRR